MNIAFLHFHLKPGGVTTVIRQQIDALKNGHDLLVLSGEAPLNNFPCRVECIPDLGYASRNDQTPNPDRTADQVVDRINHHWPSSGCDVLHIHNPLLAKNHSFLKILKALQNRDIHLFLQIHDLAEDGRPKAYFEETYPSDCHYGVINSRDYAILQASGLNPAGLHMLHNIVSPAQSPAASIQMENHIIYPVRAIRRKNVGEAILLSLFFNENETLCITLPPNSSEDLRSIRFWKNVVQRKALNVVFDAGLTYDFNALLHSSRYILTTSISEGFGFCFLEPWTADKLLWGRKLPNICRDFEKNDINLDHLYTRLNIPVDWIGKGHLLRTWETCFQTICQSYKISPADVPVRKIFSQMTRNDLIDFALLNEVFQEKIVSLVLNSKENRNVMIRLNPFLERPGEIQNARSVVEHNKEAVQRHYHPRLYRGILEGIYQKVRQNPISHIINKKKLIAQFMGPQDLSLLKWSRFIESESI